jgi:hypothetical protein
MASVDRFCQWEGSGPIISTKAQIFNLIDDQDDNLSNITFNSYNSMDGDDVTGYIEQPSNPTTKPPLPQNQQAYRMSTQELVERKSSTYNQDSEKEEVFMPAAWQLNINMIHTKAIEGSAPL